MPFHRGVVAGSCCTILKKSGTQLPEGRPRLPVGVPLNSLTQMRVNTVARGEDPTVVSISSLRDLDGIMTLEPEMYVDKQDPLISFTSTTPETASWRIRRMRF